MLFGVRLVVDSMRKSVSLNNFSQYIQDPPVTGSAGNKDVTAGYASADEAAAVHLRSPSNSAIAASRDRKRVQMGWSKNREAAKGNPDVAAMNKKFGMIHGLSSLANILSFGCLSMHSWYLAGKRNL